MILVYYSDGLVAWPPALGREFWLLCAYGLFRLVS
jgi:hypothetical protein